VYRSLRIAILSLGALLGVTAGCEQHQAVTSPGALPRHLSDEVGPRINHSTMFAHAHLLERKGDYERAVVQYQKVLAEQPQFLLARNRLGITLNKLGQHAIASEQFRLCIAQDGTQAHLQNNLGFSLYLEGKFVESEQATARAIELKPDFGRARMNHAVVLSKLGRHGDAYDELKSIGSEADACFNMGILLTESGQYADAAQYLEAALQADPRFEDARTQLHEVARLAAENQARSNARLASQETGGARRTVAMSAGIEDVHTIDASPTPTAPTAADRPLAIEEVWGVPSTPSESETTATPAPVIRTNDARTTGSTARTNKSTRTPTMTIEDVAIDEIEPVRIPVQQDARETTRAPVEQERIVAAEPEQANPDASVESIAVADIEPIASPPDADLLVTETNAPAIEIAPEPVAIEQSTPVMASTTQTNDAYVVIETIDLDAHIRDTARTTNTARAPIEAIAPATEIEIPVTTVADTTDTPITQPRTLTDTATPIESKVVIVETIEDVAIDPAPAVTSGTETKAQATETVIATPIRQTPTESTPSVIIEDIVIEPITDTQRVLDLIVKRTQVTTGDAALLADLGRRVEELLDPRNGAKTADLIQAELANDNIDTILADAHIAELLGKAETSVN
jgi:Tfp pilus assembly protein PilF